MRNTEILFLIAYRVNDIRVESVYGDVEMKKLFFTPTDFFTHSLTYHERERVAEIANEIYNKWLAALIREMLSYSVGVSLLTEEPMKELFE